MNIIRQDISHLTGRITVKTRSCQIYFFKLKLSIGEKRVLNEDLFSFHSCSSKFYDWVTTIIPVCQEAGCHFAKSLELWRTVVVVMCHQPLKEVDKTTLLIMVNYDSANYSSAESDAQFST